jgi:hypothetical protein
MAGGGVPRCLITKRAARIDLRVASGGTKQGANRGQCTETLLRLQANPHEFRILEAGRAGIEPAPCGFGVRLVPSTTVHSRPPHLDLTGFCVTLCRLVSTCVAVGCC